MSKWYVFFTFLVIAICAVGVLVFGYRKGAQNQKFHTSMYYFDNSDFFAASLKPFASTTPVVQRPRIFITNQHVLAASLIAHQFALARDASVTRVVLMTQNNWDAGVAPIITSTEDWKTPLGAVAVDASLTNDLLKKNLAAVDEPVFVHEHGITGIMPYVAYAFPHAEVTVLVIRDKTPDALLDSLAAELETHMDANTVVVGTIDMSHYLPKYLADVHDEKTIEAISHFDYDAVSTLDIDTAPTLRVILKVASAEGKNTFTVTGHTNSADITMQPSLLSTTSYITGYFTKGERDSSFEPVHLLVEGKMLENKTLSTAEVARMFLGTDAVVHASDVAEVRGSKICIAPASTTSCAVRITVSPSAAAVHVVWLGAQVRYTPVALTVQKGEVQFSSISGSGVY